MRFFALIVCLPAILTAQDPREIVRRSVEIDRKNVEIARSYTFLQRQEERELESAGKVKSTQIQTWDVTLLEGSPYRRLVARNDQPLPPKEQKKEEDKLGKSIEQRRKETKEQREGRIADWERRQERQREPLKELPDAFDFRLIGEEALATGEAYVIDATPKPGYKPKLPSLSYLPKLKARLWIDKNDYHWARVEVETLDTISFGGFLVRLSKGGRLIIEQARVNQEVWLPKRVTLRASARIVLIKSVRGELIITFSDYKKFQVDSRVVSARAGHARPEPFFVFSFAGATLEPMLLVTGPAGSGKTAFVVDRFREALRTGNDAIRLLAPTATMAQHLQNRIAREGLVFRRSLIQTLSGFVEDWAGDVPQAPDTVLCLMVEEAARRVNRPEFARVAHMPGFCASLARTIAEFSSAGCDSARLASSVPESPLGAAFLAVYQEVDRELKRRGLAMRAKRLERAAERIESQGLGGIRTVWLDGFHTLPDPELRVIGALSRHADLTLTLGDGDVTETARARLDGMGFREERATRSRSTPAMALARAPGIEREAEEIARRILEQAAAGRPFREMGIIVRAAETYVPILRSTLERFGIPARFYFDSELERHAVVRFLGGAVDAMLGGWDHAQTLKVLRLAPRFADSNAMDRFDFAVREQIPNAGLGALKALLVDTDGQPHTPGAERLIRKIDGLAAIEEWRSFELVPKDWAARFRTLRNLFRAARPGDRLDHELALIWRSQAAVLGLFDEALDEAAQALGNVAAITLEDFWRVVKSVLRLKPLRLADGRRNVVHVLSAEEARQWVLPVVFVCGMVEKQFPRFHPQDPFFPDAARCRLNAAGIRVRTAAEFEREERALFDSAVTRATMLVTLSYPEFDARGDRNLPSLYLEDLLLAPEESRAVRPEPRYPGCPLGPLRGPAEIRMPGLLDVLREKTAKLSPTDLESFLQCPFQYFGRRTLRLKAAPSRPQDRLDFLMQGKIVHEVLAAWWADQGDVAPLFEDVFERYLEEKRIPSGYHTERLRNAMLDDLRGFAGDDKWPRGDFQSRMEEKFLFRLDESLEISGKIDRLDTAQDGRAYVIDYKYSSAQSTKDKLKDENLLQAPLYLMAAEETFKVKAAGMFYVGLKGGVVYAGWSEIPEGWLERKKDQTLQVVAEIRAGRVNAAPANPDKCRYCEFRDVCRVEAGAAEALAEGA